MHRIPCVKVALVTTVLGTACVHGAAPSVTTAECAFSVPADATRFWREVPCGFRAVRLDLIGWYRSEREAPSQWQAIIGSRDSARPGAVVRGFALRIGQHCVLDGGGDDFVITAISSHGFWGYWVEDLGIAVLMDTLTHRILPNSAGFFCATREEGR